MRFTVIGTDIDTGDEMELTLEAKTADHAEHLATKRGINVQRVKIAASELSQPATLAAAPMPVTAAMPRVTPTMAAPAPAAPVRYQPSQTPPMPRTLSQQQPATQPLGPASITVTQLAPQVAAPAVAPVTAKSSPAAHTPPPEPPTRTTARKPHIAAIKNAVAPFKQLSIAAMLLNRADRPRGLGLIALGLGGVALLFCWIPVVGMISVPMCLIGAGAGAFGAWTRAATRSPRDRATPSA